MPTCSSREVRIFHTTQVVLREARRLHHAARSDSLSTALPVLRRLLVAGTVPVRTLPELFRRRATVQRKHVLRALAIEAGHASWEDYSRVLPHLDPLRVQHGVHVEHSVATLKRWFASESAALQFAAEHGGRALRVGQQAVVLPASDVAVDEAGN